MLSLPNVDGVRLATASLEDLDRISIVAAAAFFWSPTFRFQRPRYNEFPTDTIASYWTEYEAAIRDPARVVLIAEDVLELDETDHVYEALRSAHRPFNLGLEGIVGVCSTNLKSNSCYTGHFQPASKHVSAAGSDPSKASEATEGYESSRNQRAVQSKMRDQCSDALEVYESVTGPVKLKYAKRLLSRTES